MYEVMMIQTERTVFLSSIKVIILHIFFKSNPVLHISIQCFYIYISTFYTLVFPASGGVRQSCVEFKLSSYA